MLPRIVVGLFCLVLAYGTVSAQEPGLTDQQAVVKKVSGTLECRVTEGGYPCGTDKFMLTVQADGSRTLRSNTQMPSRGMQIDITLQVDAGYQPMNAYTSNYAEGAFFGSGLFVVYRELGSSNSIRYLRAITSSASALLARRLSRAGMKRVQ